MVEHSLRLTKVDLLIEMSASVEQAAKGFSGPHESAGQQA
jgi:hypothetical protein